MFLKVEHSLQFSLQLRPSIYYSGWYCQLRASLLGDAVSKVEVSAGPGFAVHRSPAVPVAAFAQVSELLLLALTRGAPHLEQVTREVYRFHSDLDSSRLFFAPALQGVWEGYRGRPRGTVGPVGAVGPAPGAVSVVAVPLLGAPCALGVFVCLTPGVALGSPFLFFWAGFRSCCLSVLRPDSRWQRVAVRERDCPCTLR